MYRVHIYERRGSAVASMFWDEWSFPRGDSFRAGRRVSEAAPRESPAYIPHSGRLVIELDGDKVAEYDYAVGTPRIVSSANPLSFPGAGVVRFSSSEPSEFSGYDELPPALWRQVGPSSAKHVAQLRLVKMPPYDMYRDFQSGEYYVYGVKRLVVHSVDDAPE